MSDKKLDYKTDEEFIASAGQYREFFTSAVWTDLRDTLLAWREQSRDALEAVENLEEVRFEQGKLDVINTLLEFPELIQQTVLEKEIQNA